MRGLKDKVVIVTGGAGGIGEATVRRLLSEGAKVVAEKSKELFASTKDLGIGTAVRGKFKLDKSIDPSRI